MKTFIAGRCCAVVILVFIFLFPITVFGQSDEGRQTSGLPTEIGGNTSTSGNVPLSGRLVFPRLDGSQTKPTVYVSVFVSGVLIDRRPARENGSYYFPAVPREGGFLVVEIGGVEVARNIILPVVAGSISQDISVNWTPSKSAEEKKGVISVKSYYRRSEENEKLFERAIAAAAKKKKNDDAVKLFKQIVESDPKDFVAWTELGTVYYRGEKPDEAEKAYTRALEEKPDFLPALMNLGKLYLVRKQFDRAEAVLIKAVELAPDSADTHHYLGEAYLQDKKGSKAVVYLNEAIRLAPVEKAEIHLRLAALYNAAGVKDRAVAEYRLFLEKVPNHPDRKKIEKYVRDNSSK